MLHRWMPVDFRYATWRHWICAVIGHDWSLTANLKRRNCDRCLAFQHRR